MIWRMWRDSSPRWALARHQIKSLARSPLRSHIRSVCLCCSFCFVLVVGGRGRIRTFCHPVIGRGPRHSDSLPLMVPSDRLERSRPKPAVFEAAASTCSAKRALVRAEGLEPPRCYPSHSECGASAIPPRAHGALWWLRSTYLRDTNPVLYRMS